LNTPLLTNYHLCQFTNALQICKEKGEVHWSDISKYGQWMKNHHYSINGLTCGNARSSENCRNQSMYETMRNIWNNPKSAKSPYKYFDGIMYPDRLDKNKDVVYKYNPK